MRFAKWHGLGNDYLVVEAADLTAPLRPEPVRRLCDRHVGVGADGILEITRVDGSTADVVIWNPDGSTAELSGNGARIAARWLARRAGAAEVSIIVGGRVVHARMRGGLDVEIDMGTAEVGTPEDLEVAGERLEFTPVSIGNPHAVIRHDPSGAEVRRLGPLVERHPRFPQRTNVQLVGVAALHLLTVGVWERGAGETLSSGTSACAAAAAAIANGWCQSPVRVRLPGGVLHVEIDAGGSTHLVGPAQEICVGELSPEFPHPGS